jgi:hypothetical protein
MKMKNFIKFLSAVVIVSSSLFTWAQNRDSRIMVMPQIQVRGVGQGKSVVAFVVNGKAPLISSGGVATINWVNGRSEHVPSLRGEALFPHFDYVDYNTQVVRVKSNYLVLLSIDASKPTPVYLSRQIDDARCPLVPPEEDLGSNPNEGCVPGVVSPYMSDILGFISLERILNDPAVKAKRPVLLQLGVDF